MGQFDSKSQASPAAGELWKGQGLICLRHAPCCSSLFLVLINRRWQAESDPMWASVHELIRRFAKLAKLGN
jgi:hypothetical protein